MARFSIDLEGRINNFDKKKSKPLIQFLEAVVNSFYAIEERQRIETFKGVIDVRIWEGLLVGMAPKIIS